METHEQMLARWKKDPKYKDAYDDLEDEFQLFDELLKARHNAGLTQEELAARMGTKRESISRMESAGKHSPSVNTLRKYAKAVGCKLKIELVPV